MMGVNINSDFDVLRLGLDKESRQHSTFPGFDSQRTWISKFSQNSISNPKPNPNPTLSASVWSMHYNIMTHSLINPNPHYNRTPSPDPNPNPDSNRASYLPSSQRATRTIAGLHKSAPYEHALYPYMVI